MAEISWSDSNGTFYINIPSSIDIKCGQIIPPYSYSYLRFNNLPAFSMKANTEASSMYLGVGCRYDNSWLIGSAYNAFQVENTDGTILSDVAYAYAHSNASVPNNTYATCVWFNSVSVRVDSLFTADNKSDLTVPLNIVMPVNGKGWAGPSGAGVYINNASKKIVTQVNAILDAPPEVSVGTPTYPTPYAGLGTYTVPITNAEAKYGGDVSKVTLIVGQDSVVQTYASPSISNETISLIPSTVGRYTPKLVIEDSRGQTTTQTLTDIIVNHPYYEPSLDFDVFRSNSSGVRDDEGVYGLITANVTFTDAVVTLIQPTVKINGTITNNVTWYTDYNASTGVSNAISDWTTVSSGDTIYGLINGSFAPSSYQITVKLTDSNGRVSSAITQTLPTAFYTIDFQAGGKEIAFGAPANDDLSNVNGKDYTDEGLFKCNMGTAFNDMTAQEVQDFVDGLNFQKLLTIIETKKLLWTNPNPAASYGTTPISLALADYDEIEIVYRWATGATTSKAVRGTIGESVRGEGLVVSGVSNVQFASRDFSITSSGVNVAVGNYSYTDYAQWYKYSGGPGNDLIIPVKIYGIKTVQI